MTTADRAPGWFVLAVCTGVLSALILLVLVVSQRASAESQGTTLR